MPTEERMSQQEPVPVLDKDGKVLGAMRGLSHDSRDLVVESGGILPQVYYVPLSAISSNADGLIRLSLTEDDLRRQGRRTIPATLYTEPGAPDVSELPEFLHEPFEPGEQVYSTELPIPPRDLNPD